MKKFVAAVLAVISILLFQACSADDENELPGGDNLISEEQETELPSDDLISEEYEYNEELNIVFSESGLVRLFAWPICFPVSINPVDIEIEDGNSIAELINGAKYRVVETDLDISALEKTEARRYINFYAENADTRYDEPFCILIICYGETYVFYEGIFYLAEQESNLTMQKTVEDLVDKYKEIELQKLKEYYDTLRQAE